MNTPDPIMPTAIPWWKSAVIQRLALSIFVQILAVTHLSQYVAGVDLSALVDDILEAIGIASAAWAVHARVRKPMPSIVATQAKADAVQVPPQSNIEKKP